MPVVHYLPVMRARQPVSRCLSTQTRRQEAGGVTMEQNLRRPTLANCLSSLDSTTSANLDVDLVFFTRARLDACGPNSSAEPQFLLLGSGVQAGGRFRVSLLSEKSWST